MVINLNFDHINTIKKLEDDNNYLRSINKYLLTLRTKNKFLASLITKMNGDSNFSFTKYVKSLVLEL